MRTASKFEAATLATHGVVADAPLCYHKSKEDIGFTGPARAKTTIWQFLAPNSSYGARVWPSTDPQDASYLMVILFVYTIPRIE